MSWTTVRLKHLADIRVSNVDKKSVDGQTPVRLCNYTDVYYRDAISADQEFMVATATPEQIETFRLRRGDVIVTKDSEASDDIGVPAFVAESAPDLVCGYHLAVLRPRPDAIHGRYLHWCMSSHWVRGQLAARATGVTRFGLRSDVIANTLITLPPPGEQQRIADFLDSELGALASSETRICRLQELLGERGRASLSLRLHCGRSLSADSGLPPGWKLTRLKFLARLQSGITLGKSYSGSDVVDRPYLRVANVQDGRLDLADVSTIAVPEPDVLRYELRPGDVLMTEGGDNDKLGRGTVWNGEIPGCLHQNHVFAVRPDRTKLRPEYLAAVMASTHGKAYFQSTAHQTTNLASTNSAKLMNFPIPLPPAEEQDRLLQELRAGRDRAVRLDALLREQLKLLSERRDALITAAVTGQIDPSTHRESAAAA